ncbi:alpha/beta hydrolase [Kribbella antibiotica]|uniref:Alpha/beta hydrolase n=2 Tax=Kribbella antibiotica TaxID=190195 RepID=A0A4R4ZQJ0_9ACTN|nr:alpha/beta hydrolase [Kribbella antibiotica]
MAGVPMAEASQPAGLALRVPRPTVAAPIGTTSLHLVDRGRQDPWTPSRVRELMISVVYPAIPHGEPRATYTSKAFGPVLAADWLPLIGLEGPELDYARTPTNARLNAAVRGRNHPVILYSPGFGTSRTFGTHQIEDLASRGYIVVAIDHTGEAPVEFPGGRIERATIPPSDETAVYRQAIQTRVADLRFVLDELARSRSGLAKTMDLSRVGVLGFSAGGFAAAEAMLLDRRIDVGINLDGAMVYDLDGKVLGESALRGLDRPFLLFGSEGHHHAVPANSPDYDPSWAAFWQHQRGPKLDLNLLGSRHPSFADYQFAIPQLAAAYPIPPETVTAGIGTINPDRSIKAQRAYIAAWFDTFLMHRSRPLPRYPEVRSIN